MPYQGCFFSSLVLLRSSYETNWTLGDVGCKICHVGKNVTCFRGFSVSEIFTLDKLQGKTWLLETATLWDRGCRYCIRPRQRPLSLLLVSLSSSCSNTALAGLLLWLNRPRLRLLAWRGVVLDKTNDLIKSASLETENIKKGK